MAVLGSNRRGFLSFLGIGAVGGPAFVRETLAVDQTAHIQGLARGIAGKALAEKADTDWGSSVKGKAKETNKFSYNFFQKLKRQAKERARLEFIKRHGLSPYEIESAENDARQGLAKMGVPPHIKCLRSFSETRKYQLAYAYYLEQSLRYQILRDVNNVKGNDYATRIRKYTKFFTRPLDEHQYGKKSKNDYDDDDEDGMHNESRDYDDD